MFILEYKYPVTINPGKVDVYMTYRWKHLAMCPDKSPLQDWIDKQKRPDNFRIEEYPDNA